MIQMVFNLHGSLIQASDGKLYGMTSGGGSSGNGVIFSFDPSAATYTKLKDFDGNDGMNPLGSLIQASDGKLYGMTSLGGSTGSGVIFSLDPSTSTYTKLKDLPYASGNDPALDPPTGPTGSLMQASDGKLYGMTTFGGNNSVGIIFSFDPSSSTYTKLVDLDITNGANPTGSLMQATNGKLYGLAAWGGSNGYGVIFSFDPSTSTYTKLKDFDDINGAHPKGSLIQASDGKLYGMASYVIFSFNPPDSGYTNLHGFDAGGSSIGSLMQAIDGKLYGMTSGGIFSFVPSTSTYTKLMEFGTNEKGTGGTAGLIQAIDGKLYGMASGGGSNGAGVIFSFDPSAGTYTKLKDFDNTNGASPYGSLIRPAMESFMALHMMAEATVLVLYFPLILCLQPILS